MKLADKTRKQIKSKRIRERRKRLSDDKKIMQDSKKRIRSYKLWWRRWIYGTDKDSLSGVIRKNLRQFGSKSVFPISEVIDESGYYRGYHLDGFEYEEIAGYIEKLLKSEGFRCEFIEVTENDWSEPPLPENKRKVVIYLDDSKKKKRK